MHISYLPPCYGHYEPDTLKCFIKPAHIIKFPATEFVSFDNSPQRACVSICLWMETAHLDGDAPQAAQRKSLRPPGPGSAVCLRRIWRRQPAKMALCLYSAFLLHLGKENIRVNRRHYHILKCHLSPPHSSPQLSREESMAESLNYHPPPRQPATDASIGVCTSSVCDMNSKHLKLNN